MRYYSSSLTFAFGVGFLILGLVLIVYFQLHYGSEPLKVELSFSLIGVGVPLIISSVNRMLGYTKYSTPTTIAGFALCLIAISLFVTIYPEKWYYPNVTFVAVLYALGLITLFGSLFASVVEKIIESRREVATPPKTRPTQTDFETKIEDTIFLKPVKVPESEIRFKDVEERVQFGKALESGRIGKVAKVKDNISANVESLVRVREGELRVKVKDDSIAEVSKTLKAIEERMGNKDKKRIFKG